MTGASDGTAVPVDELMRRFNAACAEAGRPDISAATADASSPNHFWWSAPDVDDPETNRVAYRALWLVYGRTPDRCLECYTAWPADTVPSADSDCGHPKVWA